MGFGRDRAKRSGNCGGSGGNNPEGGRDGAMRSVIGSNRCRPSGACLDRSWFSWGLRPRLYTAAPPGLWGRGVGYWNPVGAEAFEVERDRVLDESLDFLDRITDGDAAGELGDVGAEAIGRGFDDDRVLHQASGKRGRERFRRSLP